MRRISAPSAQADLSTAAARCSVTLPLENLETETRGPLAAVKSEGVGGSVTLQADDPGNDESVERLVREVKAIG
jgi:hypothetical protein